MPKPFATNDDIARRGMMNQYNLRVAWLIDQARVGILTLRQQESTLDQLADALRTTARPGADPTGVSRMVYDMKRMMRDALIEETRKGMESGT